MGKIKFFLIFLLISMTKSDPNVTTPVVLWHGMGDTCCFPFSLGAVKKLIEQNIEGAYVNSVEIGGSIIEDYSSGFFINPNKQVEEVCSKIQNNELLKNGYHGLGFSQGAQFLRAVAQRCPNPPMKSLISIGGQHQGIFGLPYCPSLSKKSCEVIRKLLTHAAYDKWVQKELVQATYWHDPLREEKYSNESIFLADINNERTVNSNYIKNLRNLKRFVMVKFLNDTIVQPKESEWFEFYKPGQDKEIIPLRKSDIYLKNKLGLRQMESEGKLVFLQCPGNHLQMTSEWFIKNIIPFLKE